jgi:tol-pal system protein YbgF
MPRTSPFALKSTLLALLVAAAPLAALAQQDSEDPEIRIEQLEARLRELTGQNEELQYRNRQLEEQLKQLQAGQGPRGNVATAPQAQPAYPQGQPQPQSQPVDQARIQSAPPPGGRARGDVFDPAANPNAPGVPRPLGNPQQGAAPQQPQVATLPPTNSPRDEFDLGYGYIERKDYALADQTLRAFLQKYPSDRLVPEANYWLGESLYQRQRYRDAAESFLTITTKFENSTKAPDALLRLGQSLAALKEKEAACAAFGEVTRKYPKASTGVKQGVDREQKRVHC